MLTPVAVIHTPYRPAALRQCHTAAGGSDSAPLATMYIRIVFVEE